MSNKTFFLKTLTINNFEITNYHQFFNSQLNNYNIDTSESIEGLEDSGCDLDDIRNLLAPLENDSLNDCVLLGEDDAMPLDDVVSEVFPSTLAGDTAFRVEEDIPKGMKVSGHVIMNQCGCLLSRKEKDIICYKYQKHFLMAQHQ